VSPSTLVAGAVVKVAGADLAPEYAAVLADIRVTQTLNLPDVAVIRIQDTMEMKLIDSHPFEFGKPIEILMQAPEGDPFVKVFKGEVVSVEGEFEEKGVYLSVRSYGKGHRLNRAKKNKAFLDKSYSDIAAELAGDVGLSSKTDPDPAGSRKFVQQSNETNWELLARLGGHIGFTVYERDEKLYFTKAEDPLGGATKTLEWGKDLQAFRPRMTGVQQVTEVTVRGWDPDGAREIVGKASASQVKLGSKIGMPQTKASQAAFGDAKVELGDRFVATSGEADAFAKSALERRLNAYLEASGKVVGRPDLKAGDWVEVKGVGTRFSGKYLLSEVAHTYRAEKGFTTAIKITGQNTHGLVDSLTPASRRNWGGSVVVAQVTNTNDPDGLGRVKLKFPSLGNDVESWWARIASPSAGKDRGVLMMPLPNDEVLVAFEHGDVRRPYVIGSLWNGQAKPNNLVQKDGSFVLQSDKQIQQKAKETISVKGDKDFKLETTGAIAQKTQDKLAIDATQGVSVKGMKVEINANADITLNANAAVTIKAAGKLEVSATGMLKIGTAGVLQLSGSQIMLG
jgi:phage protein D